jgi:hypothetical protein
MRFLCLRANDAGAGTIPDWFVPAIAAETPDVLVCTSYVRGPQHVELLAALRAVGLRDSDVTAPHRAGGRCILVAAREPLMGGLVQPPSGSAASMQADFAHVILEKSAVHLFVLQMPEAGATAGGRGPSTQWLGDALEPYLHEPAIVVGDCDANAGDEFDRLAQRGWRGVGAHAAPSDDTPTGDQRRLQRTLVSPALIVSSTGYSTHAMRRIDVTRAIDD